MQKPMMGDPFGLTDTMWDMIVNAIGAFTISFMGWWYLKRKQTFFLSEVGFGRLLGEIRECLKKVGFQYMRRFLMSRYNPERIFKPRRTAVVEASEKNGSIGNTLMKKLRKGGFR
jgi:hypothetical protein